MPQVSHHAPSCSNQVGPAPPPGGGARPAMHTVQQPPVPCSPVHAALHAAIMQLHPSSAMRQCVAAARAGALHTAQHARPKSATRQRPSWPCAARRRRRALCHAHCTTAQQPPAPCSPWPATLQEAINQVQQSCASTWRTITAVRPLQHPPSQLSLKLPRASDKVGPCAGHVAAAPSLPPAGDQALVCACTQHCHPCAAAGGGACRCVWRSLPCAWPHTPAAAMHCSHAPCMPAPRAPLEWRVPAACG